MRRPFAVLRRFRSAWHGDRVTTALAATPGSTVAALLTAIRVLEQTQRHAPDRSGRLRLRLARGRREWRAGRLSDTAFAALAVDVAAAAAGGRVSG